MPPSMQQPHPHLNPKVISPESLQTMENQKQSDETSEHRQNLIKSLSELLSVNNRDTIIEGLEKSGCKLEENFSKKSVKEMHKSIRKAIQLLDKNSINSTNFDSSNTNRTIREIFNNAFSVISDFTRERIKEISSPPETTHLEGLKEVGEFLSIGEINEALKQLPGVNVEIPDEEIKRLQRLAPKKISEQALKEIEILTTQTNGTKPLIMQIPAKIIINGQKKPLNLKTMGEIIRRTQNAGYKKMFVSFSDNIMNSSEPRIKNGTLKAWTLGNIQGSEEKSVEEKYEHQSKILGDRTIHSDFVLAVTLFSLTREDLPNINMRLNTFFGKIPLKLLIDKYKISASFPKTTRENKHTGIGASVAIPK